MNSCRRSSAPSTFAIGRLCREDSCPCCCASDEPWKGCNGLARDLLSGPLTNPVAACASSPRGMLCPVSRQKFDNSSAHEWPGTRRIGGRGSPNADMEKTPPVRLSDGDQLSFAACDGVDQARVIAARQKPTVDDKTLCMRCRRGATRARRLLFRKLAQSHAARHVFDMGRNEQLFLWYIWVMLGERQREKAGNGPRIGAERWMAGLIAGRRASRRS